MQINKLGINFDKEYIDKVNKFPKDFKKYYTKMITKKISKVEMAKLF